jgi:hypothetical protein
MFWKKICGFSSLLLLCGVSSSYALSSTSFGFNVGFVSPRFLSTTIGAGGLMDFGFDLGPSGSIHFQPSLEFWYSHDDRYYYYWDRLHRVYPWSVFEFSLNPNVRYYLPVPRSTPVKPFLGLGVALSFPNVHYDYVDPDIPPYYYDERFDMGYNVFAGFDFKMTRNAVGFVEVRGKMGWIDASKILFGMMFPVRGGY